MRHAIRVMRHGISHQWPLRHRDPSRSCLDRMDHRARLAGPISPAGAACARRAAGRRRSGPQAPDPSK